MSTNIFQYLESLGWTRSEYSLEMISPEGVRVSCQKIADLDPTFRAAYQQKKTADQIADAFAKNLPKYAPHENYAPGVSPLQGSRPITPPRRWTPYQKLAMRLGVQEGETFGVDYCHIFEGPNTTFVFVVKNDKALVLEDLPALFPSDHMVAQFQLFVQATAE